MTAPAVCFAVGILLLDACKHSLCSRLAFSALVAAFFPVTAGTVLAIWAGKAFFL
jgi:1,4-dihydroxy-2-naphthoate octaprenyltransferase